ncbi:MAG: right-handed parallel beta-helix repeat-containing protein, partial [Clostridia bacterium]|nr:right-handed parallel beta-helix repeat-containing protein [Clostridia bacterium]
AAEGDIPKEVFAYGAPTVRILHYWHDEMMFAESYDDATGRVKLSRPSTMKIRPGDRYYFENVFSEMNEPGEWYLDAEGRKLYYVPAEDEEPEDISLSASAVTQLITIDGVNGISFENVVFECTDWELAVSKKGDFYSKYGMDSSQAAVDVEGAFTVSDAMDVHIVGCEFRNLGSTAVKFYDGVRFSSVESCVIRNVAASGVYVGGANVFEDDPSYTGDVVIDNNLIYDYGRVFFNAVGIQFTHAGNVSVTHNEIHDGYYTAVSGGWCWNYDSTGTRNNDISYNLIYNIGQGWLSDMGGIYMLGKQPGTTLTHNVIHNVACDPGQGGYGGWGIYLDEGSSDMLVEKNLVFSCSSQGFNIHYGEGNTIRNNISALNAEGQVSVGTRGGEPHATAFYYNNIYLTDKNVPIYAYMYDASHFCDNGNLMWDLSAGKSLCFATDSGSSVLKLSAARSQGFIHNETVADPLFSDPSGFDFALGEDSPAFGMNFEAWDYAEAGTVAGTRVGQSFRGGSTAYNASASGLELSGSTGTNAAWFRTLFLVLAAALVIAATAAGCFCLFRQNRQMILALPALLSLAFGAAVYDKFVNWSPVLYVVLLILCACSGAWLPALLAVIGTSRKKRIVVFAVCVVLLSVLMFGFCLIPNNVMRIGEAKAISLTLCVGALAASLTVLPATIKTVRGDKKHPEKPAVGAEQNG